MRNKYNRVFKSTFIKNVILMASGTAGAQVIALLLSPIITRLYGPVSFGIMGTFSAMISIVIPIAALTYPIAIILPKNDQDAKGLIRLSLLISLIISLISLIMISVLNQPIIKIFNLKEIAGYLYLIPVVIFLSGSMQSIEQWLIRIGRFSLNASATFFQSIIVNGGKTGIGFIYPHASVLVIFTALNNGIRTLFMLVFIRKSAGEKKGEINSKKINLKKLARDYYDFPAYRAPQEFINATTNSIPILMLTAFFGPASAGFYTIGSTVLRLPTQLIGKAVGDVFYPKITAVVNQKKNATDLLKKATLGLSILGIFPFGIIILFGPFLFSMVFGNDWEIAGEYARWISIWSFTGFINRPCVRALPTLNAQRFHLIYTIFTLIIRVVALIIGYYIFNSDIITIALFSMTGAILNLGLIYITIKISRKK